MHVESHSQSWRDGIYCNTGHFRVNPLGPQRYNCTFNSAAAASAV